MQKVKQLSVKKRDIKSFSKTVTAEANKKEELNFLKISHWNINGLRAILRKGDLAHFMKTVNPAIICLNEIKISKEKIEEEKIVQ